MQCSKNWLLEWVNPKKSTEEICQQFTNAGLEVDTFKPVADMFSGVVVAQILLTEPHPNADKLKICTVDDGKEKLQIVCGAKNAREGLTVALATVGAILPGDFKIKPAKLRGVPSNGMLCAEAELGLAESSNGLIELPSDAPVGQDLREYLQLNDEIIDIDLTPNRGDCLSIKGLARELGVINQIDVSPPSIAAISHELNDTVSVKVKAEAVKACPRYCTRVIKQVNIHQASPLWLREKLRRSGVRSINPVVDITNYVMLELGQPMHAFDLATLTTNLKVRFAKTDETLLLLDDREVTLSENTLLIADQNTPIAIAGVMGGKATGVTENTQDIVLESAFFNPRNIMGKARYYNAHSDASHRFERGVDPSGTRIALERATQLIIDLCGGKAGPIDEVSSEENLPTVNSIKLRRARIGKILGFTIADNKVEDILQRLGMQVALLDAGWEVVTPLHRFDLNLEEDLIEEVARIYGYDHIPSLLPVERLQMLPASEKIRQSHQLRAILVERGYRETMSYSFIDPVLQALVFPEENASHLHNPIASNLSVMRTSIWPSLIAAVAHNQKHQQQRVRLFEIGRTFNVSDGETIQSLQIAGIANGARYPEQWDLGDDKVDFYDVKADIEAILPDATFVAGSNDALHPAQSATVFLHEQSVGFVGSLHPRISQQLKIAGNSVLFSLDLSKVAQKSLPQYQHASKYPQIQRDLALLLEEKITFQQVYDIVKLSAGELLVNIDIFDLYRGAGIDSDKKSIAVKMTLQHFKRTLIDEEVAEIMQRVINELKGRLNAELRE